MKSITLIKIDGNIGCGKTSIISYIKQNLQESKSVYFISEPLELLESYKEHKPLNLLSNPNANCEGLIQMLFMKSLFEYYKSFFEKIPNNAIVYTDRFLDSCVIFTEALHATHKINSFEKDFLIEECLFYLKQLPEVKKICYLKRSPEFCLHNISKRGRRYEEWLLESNGYIQHLHTAYENALMSKVPNVDILVNTNSELSVMMDEIVRFSQQ